MAFLPPIIYSIWIRNTEKFNREKWLPIFFCFFWGATIAIIASIILELSIGTIVILSIEDASTINIVLAVVIAPFVEELTKPLALRYRTVKKELDEIEDGLIYGAVAGLGFSATENLIYGLNFLKEGLLFFIILISIRSFGACLLHASATAWTGYGYGKVIMRHTSIIKVIPYFILAILIHAYYNALLSFDIIGLTAGFISAMALAVISIYIVRKKIIKLDIQSGK